MPEDKPATPPAAPAAPAIDPEKLIRYAQEQTERATRAEELARRAQVAAAQAAKAAQPRVPSAIDRLAEEDVTLAPEQRKELLSQAINERAAFMAGKAVEQIRKEQAQRDAALENKLAIDAVMNQRPELSEPAAASDFAAAMTKAKFELDAAGGAYSPAQLANKAAAIYDKTFRKVETPPFVEGTNPSMQQPLGQIPQLPQVQSVLEKTYGIPTGKIEPLYDPKDPAAISKLNNDYVNSRNKQMLERGVKTDLAEITFAGQVTQ